MARFTSVYFLGMLSTISLCNLHADAGDSFHRKKEECIAEKSTSPMVVGMRYTTPDGIGYKAGYTTVEGFFSYMIKSKWLPFVDLRGHVFDNGKFAANAGLGARYLASSRVWGINSYYDYRNTNHQHYNQVAVGLESLGRIWDFRLNGYLPVGNKSSPLRNPYFDRFQGHFMYVRSKRDFAMKGANLEVGAHIDHFKCAPLYFSIGPYYLTGKGVSTWGGEFKARIDLLDRYLRVEGNTSYDHFFKWIGQGQVSVNIPFGKTRKMRQSNNSCSKENTYYTRLVEHVERHEIIPVGKQRISTKAIDPTTGDPLYFVFVDNTSSSLGTFESPYASLATAQANSDQGQIIYVFPGDGTSTHMSSGITLQDGQMFLGASTVHPIATTIGNVDIPALASTLPVVTNLAAAPAITLGSNNVVSGFYIENNTGVGIQGTGISNFTATQNTIVGGGAVSGSNEGILLHNISGALVINDNLFAQTTGQAENYAVHIQQTNSQCSATFVGDTFSINPASYTVESIFADLSGSGSIENLRIIDSTFADSSGSAGTALHASLSDAAYITNVAVANSTISNYNIGMELDLLSTGSIGNVTIANSNVIGNTSSSFAGVYCNLTSTGSIGSVTVTDSVLSDVANYGLYATQSGEGAIGNITVTSSDLSNNGYGINLMLSGGGSISNFLVADSTLNGNNEGLGAISVSLTGAGSISNFTIASCTMNNNISGDNSGTGLALDLESSGTIENLTVSSTTINNFSNGNAIGITMNGTTPIGNILVSDCTFDYGANGDGININVANTGTIGSLTVANSSITNTTNAVLTNGGIGAIGISNCNLSNNDGFGLSVASSDFGSNIAISNCNLNNNDFAILFNMGTGSLGNVSISDSTLNYTDNIAINVTTGTGGPATIGTFVVSNCTMNTNSAALEIQGTISIDQVQITGSNFSNSSGDGILLATDSISELQVSNSTFTGTNTGLNIELGGTSLNAAISSNAFNISLTQGLSITTSSGSNVISVSDNTFIANTDPSLGYGAEITNSAGTLCLDFVQNKATPANSGGVDPYSFVNSGGTFNLTGESTQANNIGTISSTGISGTCTQ